MMMKNGLFLLLALLLAVSCRQKENTVRIATKPITEQFILGEMLKMMIEAHTPLAVKLTKGIGGGTSHIHPALVQGDFDLYPEYTGTGWQVVLKKDSLLPKEQLYRELRKEYEQNFDLVWIGPYGFNNTYSLAVNRDLADKYGLRTFSDLERYPDEFVFGAEYDFFEIYKGYHELCECYGIRFKETKDMDVGLKYEAIKTEKVDVVNIFTTDGQLEESGLVVLEDDKHFFPSYYCATVIRRDVLDRYPELEPVLQKMNGLISDREMAHMNYEVDMAGRSERDVAGEFLKKKGMIN